MTRGEAAQQDGAGLFDALTDSVWLMAAMAVHLDAGGDADEHDAAARLLLAHGLVQRDDAGTVVPTPAFAELVGGKEEACRSAIRSLLSQAAGLASHGFAARWQSQDPETLRAQGRASAMAGTFLATGVVPTLDGLAERFADGGVLLDIGVGVAELASAFCEQLPAARAIGVDPFPLAIELARETVAERGLADRIRLRQHGVEDVDLHSEVDLAWLPAPFIPPSVIAEGIARLHRALRPGGWLVIPGATVDAGVRGATAQFQVAAAGGTAMTATERSSLLAAAGFDAPVRLDVPAGAPEMWAARRPR